MAAERRGGGVADEAKKHEIAEADYVSGMKYKDIAKKHGVSLATVKSWKTRYGWDRKGKSAKSQKGMHTKPQESMHTKMGGDAQEKEPAGDEVTSVMENAKLNDKQRLFCVLYTRCFNATKAYQKAYGVDYATAASISYRLLENDGVKNEIMRLKKSRLNREMLSEEDIVQMYIDILYADISDYVDVKNNMLRLSGPLADGRLIKKVSFGKTDSIELMDKGAALKWLSEHMDLATDRQKAEINLIKARVRKENGDEEGIVDDGFLEALEGSAPGDWADEED
jgi:phage terminase small subunit